MYLGLQNFARAFAALAEKYGMDRITVPFQLDEILERFGARAQNHA
jgi:hypothetical protein